MPVVSLLTSEGAPKRFGPVWCGVVEPLHRIHPEAVGCPRQALKLMRLKNHVGGLQPPVRRPGGGLLSICPVWGVTDHIRADGTLKPYRTPQGAH